MLFFVIDDIEGVDVIMLRGVVVMGNVSTIVFQEEEYIINSADSVCFLSLDWLDVEEESLSSLVDSVIHVSMN